MLLQLRGKSNFSRFPQKSVVTFTIDRPIACNLTFNVQHFWYEIHTTGYHFGCYEAPPPSTKELHGYALQNLQFCSVRYQVT